ncbi:hypothetical protein SA496_01310 [Pseudomonas sp. JS3066]|nr:hypothetical protein [Pseudomonas sp. JS3066]WVK93853.1 hypothetical protein SA496_01310 [Pseudomonas sp. JS3066]
MMPSVRVVAVVIGVLALVVLGAGLVWWGLGPRIELEAQRAAHAEGELADEKELTALQARVLERQQQDIGVITDLERRMRQIGQAVDRNASAQAVAIEELKAHDQSVTDYLRTAVPVALGRLYERPDTTDPAAYRSPAVLPAGALPPAGAAGAGQQRGLAPGGG